MSSKLFKKGVKIIKTKSIGLKKFALQIFGKEELDQKIRVKGRNEIKKKLDKNARN